MTAMKTASDASFPRLQRFVSVVMVMFASTLLIASSAAAQSTTPPYFQPGSFTEFRAGANAFEAVNSDGTSTFIWPQPTGTQTRPADHRGGDRP